MKKKSPKKGLLFSTFETVITVYCKNAVTKAILVSKINYHSLKKKMKCTVKQLG